MDFSTLSRRDLQCLCKKNRIPANITNVAMTEALQALQTVEGIDEIKEALLQYQSPKKLNLVSPAQPRTTRRTTASRTAGPAKEEGQQASPLPRSRRVSARPSEILMDLGEGEESKKEEGAEPKTAVNTRRRAVGATAGRRTRQSAKTEMGTELMSEGLRRSTRVRGKAAVKMASLAMEEEKVPEVEEETVEVVAEPKEEDKEPKDEAIQELKGLEDSPIRGLMTSNDQAENDDDLHQDTSNQQQSASYEIENAPEKGWEIQDLTLSGEAPVSCDQVDLSGEAPASCDQIDISGGDLSANSETTVESPAEITEPESTVKEPIEDDDDKSTGKLEDLAVDVPVEIKGDDRRSGLVAGDITVEANEEEKSPAIEIVGELIAELSDLNLSAGNEVASTYNNEEEGDLTELTVKEVGPTEKVRYNEMSLRKLKAVYKEKRALDENCNN